MSGSTNLAPYPPRVRRLLNDPQFVHRRAESFVNVWEIFEIAWVRHRMKKRPNQNEYEQIVDEVLGPTDDEHEAIKPEVVKRWREQAPGLAHFLSDYAKSRGLDFLPLRRFAESPSIAVPNVLRAVRDIIQEARSHAGEQEFASTSAAGLAVSAAVTSTAVAVPQNAADGRHMIRVADQAIRLGINEADSVARAREVAKVKSAARKAGIRFYSKVRPSTGEWVDAVEFERVIEWNKNRTIKPAPAPEAMLDPQDLEQRRRAERNAKRLHYTCTTCGKDFSTEVKVTCCPHCESNQVHEV